MLPVAKTRALRTLTNGKAKEHVDPSEGLGDKTEATKFCEELASKISATAVGQRWTSIHMGTSSKPGPDFMGAGAHW